MSRSADQILKAAWTAFSRHGYKRTTMNDIAEEAGVARQTLYNAYAGKEEVARAVMRAATAEGLVALDAGLAERDDFGDKLDFYFETGPLSWFDMARSTPQMAEMIEGVHTFAKAEKQELEVQWTKRLAGMLRPFEARIAALGTDVETLAATAYGAASAAKYDDIDRDTFLARMAALRAMLVSVIGDHPEA